MPLSENLTFIVGILDAITSSAGYRVTANNFGYFLGGAGYTLFITATSVAMGMVLGLFAAFGRMSKNKILFGLSTAYVDFFRGTPLFVQIFLLYFGILPLIYDNDPLSSAIIALGVNSGAYIAEILRAGIQAIDKGQMEAARSLGMNERQAMVLVILPQAFKVVIPPLINEFITLLKDSSLVSAITVAELMHRGDLVFANTYQATWVFGTISIIYLVMTKTISMLGDYAERRLATE
ncbi:MAG TPA: amino acid ABC transporter permease [Syntrophomonadaceae bacterium]|jgi:polar amino acid transport system permease protein|nr:amino acid ABC transporter permease [Syntrophomonadaceae bacterium]HPU47739.1 amino acid ABC transporter permease [Syntrophomonadaceae bacterium]